MSTDRTGTGRPARMRPPQWILGVLGVALVVAAVVELLGATPVWLSIAHLAAGVVALAGSLRPRVVKPAALVVGAVFVLLYVVEAASPDVTGDSPDPSSNVSLILTGVVLIAVLVAFMWPVREAHRTR